jgi:phage tail-like protein
VVEYREGGDQTTVTKLPGKTTFPDIMLKWGIADDRELYDWHRQAVLGPVDRRNGAIILQSETGAEVIRWNFFRAWPSKYDAPDLNATGKEVAIETLTLVCERFERA